MKAGLYARVSTADKDQDPETQLIVLRDHARNQGWDIAGEWVDTASATDLRRRHRWRDLLDAAQARQVDVVLVVRLDRAFRSSKDTHDTLAALDANGVKFLTVTQPIDTVSATGRLVLGILAATAEFEKTLITERVNDGLARARRQGKKLGRPPGSKDKKERKKRGYYLRHYPTAKNGSKKPTK